LGLLALLVLAACASAPERGLSLKAPSYATLPNGSEPLNPTQPSPIYAAVTAIPGDNVIRYLERKRGHALNMLSLSGGGQNGAFGAGFLIGWRESGRRPEFDVVGGVSTGALLATHAFLGTPADDLKLEEMYTQVTKDDIYEATVSGRFGSSRYHPSYVSETERIYGRGWHTDNVSIAECVTG
jgi:hypothetical protein